MRGVNGLAVLFDWLGEVFERFNPAAFRFLAAFLPYLTPLPVAWLTMSHASDAFGFPQWLAFVFVLALEGIGLWFTSLLVENVIEVIKSKNPKAWILTGLLTVVVAIYVTILVALNVLLEDYDQTMAMVVTMLCILPLLTGFGNGYYKWTIGSKSNMEIAKVHQEELDAKIRQENNQLKLQKAMVKQGMNPLQVYNSDTVSTSQVAGRKKDWRELTQAEKREVKTLTVEELTEKYDIGKSTAFRWKQK